MIRFCLFLIIFFKFVPTDAQIWIKQNSGNTGFLSSVYFINSDTGYAIDAAGVILKTIDGGTNWTNKSVGSSIWLNSICFTNENNGYIVGISDSILSTSNGGISWKKIKTVKNVGLNSVFFTKDNVGYAVGGYGIILKTTDGFNSTVIQSVDSTLDLKSVYFPDSNTGFAVGSERGCFPIILKTTNGGVSWNRQYIFLFDQPDILYSVFFINKDTGYVVGNKGMILNTINGIDWTSQASGVTYTLNSVYFTDPNSGYVVGDNGTILVTRNGGLNWKNQYLETSILFSIHFPSKLMGYVVGWDGTILKTTNGANDIFQIAQKNDIINITPNPANDYIDIVSELSGNSIFSVQIYNSIGISVQSDLNVNNNKHRLLRGSLTNGIYIVKVRLNNGREYIGKVVLE